MMVEIMAMTAIAATPLVAAYEGLPAWAWGLAGALALYALAVLVLVLAGRREDAGAVARLVPDCAILARRLARDRRMPRRHRWLLLALVGYLLVPFDVVPDFVPVVGALDDALVVVWALRSVLRAAGPEAVTEHWPGPPRTLGLLLRAIG
jgi:uncharacterized membrane protein YkvA (DUF1232 family)